jgi:hypothetical protein
MSPNTINELAMARQKVAQLEQQQILERNGFASTMPNIEDLVNRQVQAILAPYLQAAAQAIPAVAPTSPVAPVPDVPLSPKDQMLQSIARLSEDILTQDQLQWLAQPKVFEGILVFLKSGKGQQALGLLIDEYKAFLS